MEISYRYLELSYVSLAVLALYVFKLVRVVRPPAIHIPRVASGVASQDLPILL
jgi:hypothetical protein